MNSPSHPDPDDEPIAELFEFQLEIEQEFVGKVVREIQAWDDCTVAIEFAFVGWAEVVGGLLGALSPPVPGEEQ